MYTFAGSVAPGIDDEIVKNIAETTVLKDCKDEAKKIYIDNGIQEYTPQVYEFFKAVKEDPSIIRPDSYMEFGNSTFIIADAESENGETKRIVHAVVTSPVNEPLGLACGRIDTDEDVDHVVGYDLKANPDQCITYLKSIKNEHY